MRRTHRLPQRLIRWTGFAVSFSLITSSVVTPATATDAKSPIRIAQGQRPFVPQGQRQAAPKDKGKRVAPRQPEMGTPSALSQNLDEARQKRTEKLKAPTAIESTMRSRRKPLESRNGRKVGDPLPTKKRAGVNNSTDGSERVQIASAERRSRVGTPRLHHALSARSLPAGGRNNPSPAILLSLIRSARGLAYHSAFDFLHYPNVHSDRLAANVLELHGDTGQVNLPEVRLLSNEAFHLFTPIVPQSGSSKIVYASNRDGSMQIYVMNADGSGVTRLTYSGANDDYPRWSPNGTKILFQSDRDHPDTGYNDIYIMNSDGSGVTRLTSDPSDDSMASWSPDGSKIVFQSLGNGSNYRIYSMNADGSGPVNLMNTASNDIEPSWSPDGSKIAFASDRDHPGYYSVYVMNSNGTGQQRLTFSASTVDDRQPAWSPNGSKIAFVSTRDSATETWQETDDLEIPEDDGQVFNKSRVHLNKEVYSMNSDGSGQTRLTNELANDDAPSWSPDGSKIVFRSDRERDCCDPMAQVWTMNSDGSGQTDVSNDGAGNYTASWTSGNGNQLPVANAGGLYSGIIAQNVPFNGGSSYDPDGSVVSYSWAFGDGGTGSGVAPTHAYTTAGSYTVTLTVTDNLGAQGSASATISVCSSSSDQFATTFLQAGLGRAPYTNESGYWTDIMRSAYAQGQTSMFLATTEFGMTVFESAAYIDRGRNDQQYVSDLYHSYLMREPEACQPNDLSCGPNYWADQASPLHMGREAVRRAFEDSIEFHNIVANLAASGSPSSAVSSLSTALVDPFNQSGDQMRARDCEWSVPLVSLPGRAGLDLGLSLSYSSLIWTPSGPYMYFDQDNESISPGFTIGFPKVQWRSFDAKTSRNVYLLMAAGRRVELRQVGTSNVYEAADSSYLQLIDYGGSLLLRSTDGTQLSFGAYPNGWQVTQVKDRNGNTLTVNNDWRGDIQYIADTMDRTLNFDYDPNSNLIAIKQWWPTGMHYWATFGWGTTSIYPSFGGQVVGTHSGEQIPVLTMVGFLDGTYDKFSYNGNGQVERITHYASDSTPNIDNHPVNYSAYSYDSPSGDCPRITAARVWAENWSDQNNVPHEVVTSFEDLGSGWRRVTTPDLTAYTEQYGTSGWQRGLSLASEVWSEGVRQKWTTVEYRQDDMSASFQTNPRVIETNVYDVANNRRRVTIDYSATVYAQYGLPYFVSEYGAGGSTEIRRTYTDYNLSQAYQERRIIGLVSATHVLDTVVGQWKAKTTYGYDDPARLNAQATNAPGHDPSYDGSLNARGNVTSISRWDATDPGNANKALTSYVGYDAAGNALSATDPAGHTNWIGYGDSFSDGNNSRGTFAYPTNALDADNNWSYAQYNFDFGAKTRVQGPPPLNQPNGIIQTFAYDEAARLLRVTTANTGAYIRYVYQPTYTQSFSTVNHIDDDAYSVEVFDGLGQVFEAANYHPGSSGGYRAVTFTYDKMGRVVKRSNPTEINGNWQPTGDDNAGWVTTSQTYDWKGRPLVTTHLDGWQRSVSYGGCGCAGGEITTGTDEAGRRKRTTADVLGRMIKAEQLNWDGSVYSTANYVYTALDQISSINYEGQTRSFVYDGYGRLQTRTTPEQGPTNYYYNSDDTTYYSTDARGVTSTFTYNGRHQVRTINFSIPSGVAATPNVTIDYDGAGNRASTTDSNGGAVSYVYDSLSRMTSETRTLPVGSYSLTYNYNYASQLTSITNPWSASVGYDYDNSGRLLNISGAGYAGVTSYASNINYRAFGAVKSMSFGDQQNLSNTYDNRMRPTASNVSNVLGYSYNYFEHTSRVNYAQSTYDPTLDRSWEYDQVAALVFARSGSEARAAWGLGPWGNSDGPYAHVFDYDKFGNMTRRFGWGGEVQGGAPYGGDTDIQHTYTNNQRNGFGYDLAGNLTNDLAETYTYNGMGQQATATASSYFLSQGYDGDGLRNSKVENGAVTYYLRSSVLGGAVVAEIDSNGGWSRGYVYAGSDLLAVQQNGVYWSHEDDVTKSKRITDSNGNVVSTIELDSWGANTNRSTNSAFMPQSFTSYIRDANGGQDAMARRYSASGRFAQPDPYGGSYDFSDPQSLNRYAYTKNDPVNLRDPSGLMCQVIWEGSTHYLEICTPGSGSGSWGGYSGTGGKGIGPKDPVDPDPPDPPQNPVVGREDLNAYKARIEQMLKDEKCASFINQLLNEAKTLTGRSYNDVLGTFDSIKFSWVAEKPWHGGHASFESGRPIATIDNTVKTEKFISADRTGYLISSTTQSFLGETLHHVGVGGMYGDGEMAQALNNILVSQGKDQLRTFDRRGVDPAGVETASKYWHPKVENYCHASRQ